MRKYILSFSEPFNENNCTCIYIYAFIPFTALVENNYNIVLNNKQNIKVGVSVHRSLVIRFLPSIYLLGPKSLKKLETKNWEAVEI